MDVHFRVDSILGSIGQQKYPVFSFLNLNFTSLQDSIEIYRNPEEEKHTKNDLPLQAGVVI